MIKKRLLFFLFLLMLFAINVISGTAYAYVQNQTQENFVVHWGSSISLVDIFVNPINSQALSSAEVQNEVGDSVAEWDGKSRIRIRKNSTAGSNQEGLNEIYFSSDPTFFNGTGVVGITQVFFKSNSGEILEADILVNDDFTFSTNIQDSNYLGNVLTHEMGHLLGLGHSQVIGSTMFYSLSRGQNKIDYDDKAGIYSMYPNGDSTKGIIAGKIVGGSGLVGVFGADVQAISLKTGKISGASISSENGTFSIDGLEKNEQYYLYVKPITLVGLPEKFDAVKINFCETSRPYRGSFFQACGSSFEGFPQAVKLNSSQVNTGNITIRCGIDVPPSYMQTKNSTPATFDIQNMVSSGVGNSFVGFFSGPELSLATVSDYFRMNYSGINWSDISPTGDLFVELKIINQSFFSPFKANVTIKRDSSTTNVLPKYVVEADGWLNLETVTRIAINRADSSDNDFEIVVTPESMVFPNFPSGLPDSQGDYFPSYEDFSDSLHFYLVSASIVKDNGDGTYTLVSSKNEQLSDNSQCPDAVNTYSLTNYNLKRNIAITPTKKKESAMACGTVDMKGDGGGGDGLVGLLVGIILSLILGPIVSAFIFLVMRHYKPSSL